MLKIGDKIKSLRKAQDITQEKLAAYLNISYQAISKWENGTALPDITLVPKIANFFGVSADELLCMKEMDETEELKEYVKHIHLNDNDLKVDTHLAWGSGEINRSQFYNCYDKYLSDATILIETVDIPDQRASLRQLEEDGFIK